MILVGQGQSQDQDQARGGLAVIIVHPPAWARAQLEVTGEQQGQVPASLSRGARQLTAQGNPPGRRQPKPGASHQPGPGHVFVPVWLPAALSGLECASLRFIFCHFTTSWKITATSAANAPRVVMIAPITVSQPGMPELPPLTVTAMVGGTTSVMGGAGDGVCAAVWPGEGDRVGVGAAVGVGWRVTVEWWTLFSSTRATPSPAMTIATAAPIQSCRDKESQDASGSSGGRFTAQTVAPIRATRHRSSSPRPGATCREMRRPAGLERDGRGWGTRCHRVLPEFPATM